MTDDTKNQGIIRRRAEAIIELQNTPLTYNLKTLSFEGTQKLIHELEVHQIELSLQNEELLRTEIELKDSKEKYFDLYDMAPIGYCTLNENGLIKEVNFEILNLVGKDKKEVINQPLSHFIFAKDQDIFYLYRKKFLSSEMQEECELRMVQSDKTPIWVSLTAVIEKDRLFLIIKNINDRKLLEDKRELLASVFHNAGEAILITELDGIISDVNETFIKITGYEKEEIVGKKTNILSSGRQSEEYYKRMWSTLKKEGSWKGEIWNKRKNGEVYPEMLLINTVYDYHARAQHYVALFTDITGIKEYENSLKNIAHYDQLTKLPNRVLLADRLLHGMAQTKRNKQHLAVIFLDLDGFKEVNDTYGHDVGNKLLIELAIEMKKELREGDTLARIGGDEFVIVLFDLDNVESAMPLITRLLECTAKTINIDGLLIQVTSSLGVTFYPQKQSVDADQLLRQADQAMYQAKMAGKNSFQIFNTEENNLIRERFEGINQVREAFKKKELVLYYQPKVNMRTGEVVGVEALIRWIHPQRGILPPLEFLPVIEGHILSIEIGEWVIETALKQIKFWQEQGIKMPISVNIVARHLLDENFVKHLESILLQYPTVESDMLELEVLESSKLENLVRATDTMNACRSLGVTFSLDDFGTGYSSMIYLKRLPIKQIKIDQSFVRDMLDNPYDLSILEGIISLSTDFQLSVIAEGVETSEHAIILMQLGCDFGQGYIIARPMPAIDFVSWFKEYKPSKSWNNQLLLNSIERKLLSVKVQHHAWIKSIKMILRNEEHEYGKYCDASECYFGKWLDEGGQEYLGVNYEEVDLKHKNIHLFADNLLSLYHNGQTEEASGGIIELDLLRDELLKMLSTE